MTVDGYSATYDAGETSEVAIDIIVKVGAAFVSLASLVGLVLLYRWGKAKL